MSFTNFFEAAILNVLRGTTLTGITTLHVGLASAVTSDEAGTVTEITGGGYARRPLTLGVPSQGADAATALNTALVTFGPATGADWPAATHFIITDALTAGNVLAVNPLAAPRTVQVGDSAEFAIGALAVSQT